MEYLQFVYIYVHYGTWSSIMKVVMQFAVGFILSNEGQLKLIRVDTSE
jgi:hypothetical protein